MGLEELPLSLKYLYTSPQVQKMRTYTHVSVQGLECLPFNTYC